MTLTEDQRIAIIRHAVENSQKVAPSQSVADFIEEIKSEQFFEEHGLLDANELDIEDEMSLIENTPTAESEEEEEQGLGVSDEMKGVYND